MMAIDPIGKIVGHKVFGKGKIIDVYSNASSNLISVQFEKVTKSFAYPGAFEKFLTFEDGLLQKAIEEEIAKPKKPEPTPPEPPRKKVLKRDITKGYGGKAQDIYDQCCKWFGWDYSKRYLFGMMRILYAEEATPEKYSPWFLPHNNWTDTKGGNWFNKIYNDVIEEMWLEKDERFHNDDTLRVTFVKNHKKEYVFLGIYKPVKKETRTLKTDILKDGKIIKRAGVKVGFKTYQLVSDVYPQIIK